jgi:hypothetical protein
LTSAEHHATSQLLDCCPHPSSHGLTVLAFTWKLAWSSFTGIVFRLLRDSHLTFCTQARRRCNERSAGMKVAPGPHFGGKVSLQLLLRLASWIKLQDTTNGTADIIQASMVPLRELVTRGSCPAPPCADHDAEQRLLHISCRS